MSGCPLPLRSATATPPPWFSHENHGTSCHADQPAVTLPSASTASTIRSGVPLPVMSPTATEAPLLAGANQSGTVRKPAEIIETPEDQTVVPQMQEITMEEPGCDPLPGPAHPGSI